jgi:hypothetical protein
MILKVVPVIWNTNAALSRCIAKANLGAVKNSAPRVRFGPDPMLNQTLQRKKWVPEI